MPAGEHTLNWVSETQTMPFVHVGFAAVGGSHPGYLNAPLHDVSH